MYILPKPNYFNSSFWTGLFNTVRAKIIHPCEAAGVYILPKSNYVFLTGHFNQTLQQSIYTPVKQSQTISVLILLFSFFWITLITHRLVITNSTNDIIAGQTTT